MPSKPRHILLLAFLFSIPLPAQQPAKSGGGLVLRKTIRGGISPKSIAHSGSGLFFAQNMMYKHSVTVYDRRYQLVKTIPDEVRPSQFGLEAHPYECKGAPVEACFTQNGKTAWVTNYQMYGKGFAKPGTDNCKTSDKYDKGLVYKISTETLAIEGVAQAGCVPKFIAATPDGCSLLATNWCSGDLSIIDTGNLTESKRVKLGRYPRGIAVNPKGTIAYVAIMGANKIAAVDLGSHRILYEKYVGRTPRHLCLSPSGRHLYISLNGEGAVAKMDVFSREVVAKTPTGRAARSMALTANGSFLYVANYLANTLCKVRTADMKVLQTVKTNAKPIGVTIDEAEAKVWVACYTGSIMVFEDLGRQPSAVPPFPDGEKQAASGGVADHLSQPLPPLQSFAPQPDAEPATQTETNITTVAAQTPKTDGGKETTQIVEKPPPQPAKTQPQGAMERTGKRYYTIAGSFGSFAAAMEFAAQLNARGYPTAALVKGNGKPYRVCYGSHRSRAAAAAQASALKAKGMETWIFEQP